MCAQTDIINEPIRSSHTTFTLKISSKSYHHRLRHSGNPTTTTTTTGNRISFQCSQMSLSSLFHAHRLALFRSNNFFFTLTSLHGDDAAMFISVCTNVCFPQINLDCFVFVSFSPWTIRVGFWRSTHNACRRIRCEILTNINGHFSVCIFAFRWFSREWPTGHRWPGATSLFSRENVESPNVAHTNQPSMRSPCEMQQMKLFRTSN